MVLPSLVHSACQAVLQTGSSSISEADVAIGIDDVPVTTYGTGGRRKTNMEPYHLGFYEGPCAVLSFLLSGPRFVLYIDAFCGLVFWKISYKSEPEAFLSCFCHVTAKCTVFFLSNLGWETWPPGCSLRFTGNGDQMTHIERVALPSLKPGEMYDASVELESPDSGGIYQGQWRMCTPTGIYCGGKALKIPCSRKTVFCHGDITVIVCNSSERIIGQSTNFKLSTLGKSQP